MVKRFHMVTKYNFTVNNEGIIKNDLFENSVKNFKTRFFQTQFSCIEHQFLSPEM